MSEIRKVSIALTSEQINVLRAVVKSGQYATTSEVIREAIRDWQRKHHVLTTLAQKKNRRKSRKHKKSRSNVSRRRKTSKRKR